MRVLDAVFAVDLNNELAARPFTKASSQGETPLHVAALNDDAEQLEVFLRDGGIDINCGDHLNASPLIVASASDCQRATAVLLRYGANLCKADVDGFTALHHAAYGGHDKIIRLLLDAEADLLRGSKGYMDQVLCEYQNTAGWTPIDIARASKDVSVVKVLKEYFNGIVHAREVETARLLEIRARMHRKDVMSAALSAEGRSLLRRYFGKWRSFTRAMQKQSNRFENEMHLLWTTFDQNKQKHEETVRSLLAQAAYIRRCAVESEEASLRKLRSSLAKTQRETSATLDDIRVDTDLRVQALEGGRDGSVDGSLSARAVRMRAIALASTAAAIHRPLSPYHIVLRAWTRWRDFLHRVRTVRKTAAMLFGTHPAVRQRLVLGRWKFVVSYRKSLRQRLRRAAFFVYKMRLGHIFRDWRAQAIRDIARRKMQDAKDAEKRERDDLKEIAALEAEIAALEKQLKRLSSSSSSSARDGAFGGTTLFGIPALDACIAPAAGGLRSSGAPDSPCSPRSPRHAAHVQSPQSPRRSSLSSSVWTTSMQPSAEAAVRRKRLSNASELAAVYEGRLSRMNEHTTDRVVALFRGSRDVSMKARVFSEWMRLSTGLRGERLMSALEQSAEGLRRRIKCNTLTRALAALRLHAVISCHEKDEGPRGSGTEVDRLGSLSGRSGTSPSATAVDQTSPSKTRREAKVEGRRVKRRSVVASSTSAVTPELPSPSPTSSSPAHPTLTLSADTALPAMRSSCQVQMGSRNVDVVDCHILQGPALSGVCEDAARWAEANLRGGSVISVHVAQAPCGPPSSSSQEDSVVSVVIWFGVSESTAIRSPCDLRFRAQAASWSQEFSSPRHKKDQRSQAPRRAAYRTVTGWAKKAVEPGSLLALSLVPPPQALQGRSVSGRSGSVVMWYYKGVVPCTTAPPLVPRIRAPQFKPMTLKYEYKELLVRSETLTEAVERACLDVQAWAAKRLSEGQPLCVPAVCSKAPSSDDAKWEVCVCLWYAEPVAATQSAGKVSSSLAFRCFFHQSVKELCAIVRDSARALLASSDQRCRIVDVAMTTFSEETSAAVLWWDKAPQNSGV
eukprot:Rmarinus@m.14288